jgi:hypothetical protein
MNLDVISFVKAARCSQHYTGYELQTVSLLVTEIDVGLIFIIVPLFITVIYLG